MEECVVTLLLWWLICQPSAYQFQDIKWSNVCGFASKKLTCPEGSFIEVTRVLISYREGARGCPDNHKKRYEDEDRIADSWNLLCNAGHICTIEVLRGTAEPRYTYLRFPLAVYTISYKCHTAPWVRLSTPSVWDDGLIADDVTEVLDWGNTTVNTTVTYMDLGEHEICGSSHRNNCGPVVTSPTPSGQIGMLTAADNDDPKIDVGSQPNNSCAGTIIGVGVGCLILGLLVGLGLGFCFYRRKTAGILKREKEDTKRDGDDYLPSLADCSRLSEVIQMSSYGENVIERADQAHCDNTVKDYLTPITDAQDRAIYEEIPPDAI